MSQLVYYPIRIDKPNKRFHFSYSTAETISEDAKRKKKRLEKKQWKKYEGRERIQLNSNQTENTLKNKNVIKMSYDGFDVDLNNMDINEKYLVIYSDSEYEIMKNEKGELVVSEIG